MLNPDIKNKINKLWDLFWSGGMSNPLTALEQISYLLFMRRAEDAGLIKQKKYKWSFYTNYKNTSESLVQVMKEAFDHIKVIYSKQDSFKEAMKGAEFKIDKPSLLIAAIELINEIYAEAELEREQGQHFQDTLGDFYELILSQTNEAGKNGQFRTPRHIIQFICELVKPSIEDTICDVTSGTSGFLVGAYQYIINNNSNEHPIIDENGFEKRGSGDKIKTNSKEEKKLKEETFFGYDIDSTMIRLGMMNLLMHNISKPNIKHIDSISDNFDQIEKGVQYSIILANPPFTGRIDSMEATTTSRIYPPIIKDGKRVKQKIQSEILFLERIIQLLKNDGRCGVIIPEGVLFGSASTPKSIRELLLKECDLHAVISLPNGVFMPYAGVKTSILIFSKRKHIKSGYSTKQVWFYGLESDGYSLDANRKILKEKPLPLAKMAFENRDQHLQNQRTEKSFFVPIEEIIRNNFQLSYGHYRELVYQTEQFDKPNVLMDKLMDIELEIFNSIKELKKII